MGLSKSKVFIFVVICFGLGVLLASKFNFQSEAVYAVMAGMVAVFAVSYINLKFKIALGALFLFCTCLGILRLQTANYFNEYEGLIGTRVKQEGLIIEEPDIRSNVQLLTFRPDHKTQNILVTTTLGQEFFYGDRIVVEDKLEEVKNFSDFDYEKYLERFNTYAVIRYPKILILKSHQLNPLKENLLKIKKSFSDKISSLYLEPQGSLLLGILIGSKKTLPKKIVENFNKTGISHIVAVSGFNITIIISALASLAYIFGRKASFYMASLTIIAFVIITGASASVVRAGTMGFLLLLALSIGRQYSIAPAIFLSGLVMLLHNPKILFWDIGFQLSFVATLGIIYFTPLLNELTKNWPKIFGIKTLVLTTLSAIITTLPFILFNFGMLSLSAPAVNLLVLPFVPIVMLFGFLSILPFVGPGFAFITSGLLIYIIEVVNFFANLPYSNLSFKITAWGFWFLALSVFGLFFGFKYIVSRQRRNASIN